MIKAAFKSKYQGIGLSIALTAVAFLIAEFSQFNAILLALVLGIVFGNLVKLPPSFNQGLKISSSLFLEIAIILMAFSINYASFLQLGWQTILIVVVTITTVLWATLFLSKKMDCPSNAGLLVGFGTAICGSSAIAALAPSVSEDKSDMGISMAVVNLYGLLGMLLLPLVPQEWLTDIQHSVLVGASLHSVGNVAGAGMAISDSIGEMAVTVKLGRVALLTPALLIFTQFTSKTSKAGKRKKVALPYYLVAFIIISILVSVVPLPDHILAYAKKLSSCLLAVAMAAIGLKVSFNTLISSGKKGLVFGAILFAIQLAIIAILIAVLPWQ